MAADTQFLPRLRAMQIIVFAMLAGQVVFLSIIYFVAANKAQAPPTPPLLSWMALGLFVLQLPLTVIIPTALIRAAVQRIATGTWQVPSEANPESFATDEDKLMAVRLNSLLVAMALLEGAGFFGCIAYLLEGQLLALLVVAAVVVVMVARFPTAAGVRAWLERQTQRLVELRQS